MINSSSIFLCDGNGHTLVSEALIAESILEDYIPALTGWMAHSPSSCGVVEFFLRYWGAPLLISAPEGAFYLQSNEEIVRHIRHLRARLQSQGYVDTIVEDYEVSVYHRAGAGFDAIFARRRADHAVIGRSYVHFELARLSCGWRIVSIQHRPTAFTTLAPGDAG